MGKLYSVYRLCFDDGREYIGCTCVPVQLRVAQHLRGSHNVDLRHRLNSGRLNGVEVVASGLDKSSALALEKHHIKAAENPLNVFHVREPRRSVSRHSRWNIVARVRNSDRQCIMALVRQRGLRVCWVAKQMLLLWAADPTRFDLQEGKIDA